MNTKLIISLALSVSILTSSCTLNPGSKSQTQKLSVATDSGNALSNKPLSGESASINDIENIKINHQKQAKLIDATVILTVNGEPITIGQYRENFKLKQLQVQTQLLSNPLLINHLIDKAQKNNVTISSDEKKQLMDQAKIAQNAPGSFINKDTKNKAIDKDLFAKQILDTALAFKMACTDIEKNLLSELINRLLIIEASKKDGFEKNAYQDFVTFKHANDIKKMSNEHNLTENQFKQNFIDEEMIKQEVDKIAGSPTITDKEISDFYNSHHDEFKHGKRIKLKQIFILAPQTDGPGFKSVKSQLKEKFPKASAKELAAKEAQFMNIQSQKASIILAQVIKGISLDKINPKKEKDIFIETDEQNKGSQFIEIEAMPKEMSTELNKLKPNEYCPKVFKTGIGFQIVQVIAREDSGYLPLAEVKDYIKQVLKQQQAQNSVAQWLDHARKSARIILSKDFTSIIESNLKTKNQVETVPKTSAPMPPNKPDAKTNQK